ncbi:hypothetical protein K432DRAFT_397056 [Lepidopterella palustris CBS 459.81]|uniref:Uncharacterized protein n=1 Tax=Lepidopterella palustris CBS 459.81 TaxID=1314670 RepID=A0A8E2E1Y6_9PEZI|nr:hypothetical protein K432DRAFT_397056 [Lepidopterella palustris CBS 459.81]
MKRKFAFNLAPIKVPSKQTETKVVKDENPPARRNSTSQPASPLIDRRPLSSKTESQLRAACALILQDYKPSGHVFEGQAKPKLDFDGLNRSMREKREHTRLLQQQQLAEAKSKVTPDPNKYGYKPGTALKDLFSDSDATHPSVQANISRRRDDRQPRAMDNERERSSTKNAKPLPPLDRPKTAPIRAARDSGDAGSLQTSLASSTDYYCNNMSTAPTSADFTSPQGSKRGSRQLYSTENPAAAADAAAAQWMKQELERRRRNMLAQVEPKFEVKSPSRPPSRSKSIRSEILDYVRPLSRSASRESIRSNKSDAKHERSPSSHGWRSWTLQRKTSLNSFKDSRPGSARGRSETRGNEPPKPEVNLNRELPPLPSLDKWKEQAQNPAQRCDTHIANLMRSETNDREQYAAAIRRQHRRSGSDSFAKRMSLREDSTLHTPPQNVRPRPKSGVVNRVDSKMVAEQRADSTMDLDNLTTAVDRTQSTDPVTYTPGSNVRRHKHQHSTGSDMRKISTETPNFSRKISMDTSAPTNTKTDDRRYPNSVEVTALPICQDKQSKLRKVLSGWMLGGKKEKKGNWMDKLEQNGVKGGIMIHDKAAHAPIVKY